jgi:hypothetical protein
MNIVERKALETAISRNLIRHMAESIYNPDTLAWEEKIGHAAMVSNRSDVLSQVNDIRTGAFTLEKGFTKTLEEGRTLIRLRDLLDIAHRLLTLESRLDQIRGKDDRMNGRLINADTSMRSILMQGRIDRLGQKLLAAIRISEEQIRIEDEQIRIEDEQIRIAADHTFALIRQVGKDKLSPSKIKWSNWKRNHPSAPLPPEYFYEEEAVVQKVYKWAYGHLTDTDEKNWCRKYFLGYTSKSVLGPSYARTERFHVNGCVVGDFDVGRERLSEKHAKRVCAIWANQRECMVGGIKYYMVTLDKHGNDPHYNLLLKQGGRAGVELLSLTGAKLNLHLFVK